MGVLAALQGGCATERAVLPSRFDDPNYGLPKAARHPPEGPVEELPLFSRWSSADDERRLPREVRSPDPIGTAAPLHPYWVSEYPNERVPVRAKFFLSSFMAGFMTRLAYGAYAGSRAGAVLTGSDFGAAILVGGVAGVAGWSFSFRIAPSAVRPDLSERALPSVEDTAVYRDWISPRK